ncbi:carbohydrate-binding protein [Methanosphaerula palustris]|uniref:Carbohydrate binding family 6 n=1 Tax=Methanosphaerula palustris (strain ATCC BAA-1556 / DSM 19958 / E1-9c) TaxID=521011 RepID=B8GIC1_METPE|nr:carbohydrate-binding protein [Methanosphaerula palustris]ACL15472.1 Carbohydrate binding family 6 [Methanosphaerula palustris E1-9c]
MRSEILCCYIVLAMLLGGSLLVIHADATVNILPLGDSITRGGTTADSPYPSYRYLLWNYLKTGGYDVNFIGSTTFPTFSSFSFDQNHEGHGGYTTGMELAGDSSDDPSAKLSNWLKLYTPDIVLLHIGTNDVIQQVPLATRLSNDAQIIDTLRADNPNVKILIAQIIPTSDSFRNTNSQLIAYNNALPALAAQKSTAQSPVIVVDQYTGYNGFSDNQYDGIHPQTSGEKKMADRWYAALVPLLSGGTTVEPTPVPTSAPWDSPQAIPGSIQATDYASGGEGVAYHDTTTGNQGGAYRNDDVDIEYSSVEQEFVVAYIRSGEWLTYDVNIASGGIYTVNFRVSSPNTGSTIDLEVDGSEVTMIQVPNTGSFDTYTAVQRPVYLPSGHHTLKLDFSGSSNVNYLKFTTGMPTPVPTGTTVSPTPTGSQTITPTVTPTGVERAYVSHTFPCKVEAEDYDLGGEGIAYHDTTPGNLGGEYRSDDVDIEAMSGGGSNVGYIKNGEWLAYTVSVPVTRTYVATFKSSSWAPGRSILVQVDGTPVTAVGVPNTNSSNVYDSAQVALPMTQGMHRITLTFNGDCQNLDWFDVTNDMPTTVTTPVPTTVVTTVPTTIVTTKPTTTTTTVPTTAPTTVVTTVKPTQTSLPYVAHRPPIRVEAEDYDQGGEGVAYHDTTLGNLGGQYRQDDVDIETIAAGGYDVGYIKDGEWLTYTIDAPSTSAYTAVFRMASWGAGRSIGVSVDGVQVTTVPVAMTGSYSTFTLSAASFTMTQGTHKVRLTFNGDSQNLDYFDLIPGNYAPTTTTVTPVPTTVMTTATVTTTAATTTVPTTTPTTTVPTTVVTTGTTTVTTTAATTTVPTTAVTTVTTTPAPSGTVWQIPTHIEAEDYDQGGEGVAYHDTTLGNLGGQYRQDDVDIEAISGGGYDVCYIRDGEWLRYHITVQNTGIYTATFRVGSWNQGRAITIGVDGVGVAVAAVPNTGSSSAYTTTAVAVPLAAGDHMLTLTFNGDGQNLDWFTLGNGVIQTTTPTTVAPTTAPTTVPTTVVTTVKPTTTVTTVTPTTMATTVKPTTVVTTTISPTIPTIPVSTTATTLPLPDTKAYTSLSLPGRLQAENYDNGGEGVGYHDTTPSNQGGAYRNDDADVESLIDNSGYDVCWIRDGEWLKYTVTVQQSRTYGAAFRVASPQAGGQVELKVDGTSEVTVNVPNTGSFDIYQSIGTQVPLTAGQHTITLAFHGSRMNVDYVDFV